jgi:hypothetical protein
MADRVTIVSPRDPWPFSTVTADDLEDLVAEGLLRPLSDERQPEWIPPASGAAPSPPPGYVVSFVSFHERGFGVLASRFMRAILHNYGVELHNLSPNSISQAAIFVAVCEGYLGIAPHWDLWTHLFSVELFASPTGERRVHAAVRADGCILQLRQSRASLYIPAILASSNKGWQRRWFYLRNDGEMLPPFSQRVVTVAADAWRYGTPHDRQKNLEPLLKALEALRKGGLTAAGVIAAIHRRRVLPLAERRLPLWEMTPEADLEGSRMSSDPLPIDVLHGRVAVTLGKPDASAFSQPLMCPDHGCATLVSVCSFFLPASDCPWSLRSRLFICLEEVGWHKPSRPRVPEDAVDRAARRVAAEEKKKKKDAEKARARERTRARDALEKLHRRQERDGLPREPSPETPDDDDDDEDDDEDDDMVAHLGLSPGLRLGQESSSQPPSGLAPSVPGVGTPRSRPEERGQTEGVLDPSAGEVEVTPGSQAEAFVPQEPSPTPEAQESGPQVTVAALGQSVSRASKVPKARTVPKLAARRTSAVPSGVEIRETSPRARLIMARSR